MSVLSNVSGVLEDPDHTPPADMWTMTNDPLNAPNEPVDISIEFEKGIPVKVTTPEKTYTDPVELFNALNKLGYTHAIGRIDIVENRFIGLKSRGCYDCKTWHPLCCRCRLTDQPPP